MNDERQSGHGGPGRGQGRKPIKPGERTVVVSVRMTEGQREAFNLIGGSEWVRELLDQIPPKNLQTLRSLKALKS